MSITLSEIRTQARQMSDMENNDFVGDNELNNYINFAIADLHDILVECYGEDYFLNSTTAATVSGTSDYTLPSDFYKLRGVDVQLNGSDYASIRPFNFNERNKYEDFGSWTVSGLSNIRYRVMGSNIKFSPVPDSAINYKLWYVPVATKLTSDSDTLDDVNQYSDFVIISAAIKMMLKEESDASTLIGERERIAKKINEAAKNRDAGQPESISDIYAENDNYIWYTSRS